jgi:hypothetical protein
MNALLAYSAAHLFTLRDPALWLCMVLSTAFVTWRRTRHRAIRPETGLRRIR